jgi:CubicO group peptidase (beta-lactamase class C family)
MNEADIILTKQITGGKTPGVHYLIFDKDSIIHRFHKGYTDLKNHLMVDQNTTFNAFSVTKTFTALAVMQLFETNRLNIEDPVIKYVPDFRYSNKITIKQLLAHTAGIPNPIPLSWVHLEEEHKTFDRIAFINLIFKKFSKSKSNPNEKFLYSNLGYIVLGQIIEQVSGGTYEDYIRDNIIQPLGIKPDELGFDIQKNNLQAKGYQKRFSLVNGILGFFLDKSKYMDKSEGRWKPFKNLFINGTSYGGLSGSPDGFRKYIQELLKPNSVLLSDEYKEKLFIENYTNSNKPTGMCLSWFRGALKGQEYYTHAGGGGGYYCEIRIYRDLGIGSVIMFNRSGMMDERFLDKLDKYYIDN